MGRYQYPVSIDSNYKALCREIMLIDDTYRNSRTGKANHKKICEDGIRLMHLLKRGVVDVFIIAIPRDQSKDKDFELIKGLLNNVRNSKG